MVAQGIELFPDSFFIVASQNAIRAGRHGALDEIFPQGRAAPDRIVARLAGRGSPRAILQAEIAKWTKVIDTAKVKAQ